MTSAPERLDQRDRPCGRALPGAVAAARRRSRGAAPSRCRRGTHGQAGRRQHLLDATGCADRDRPETRPRFLRTFPERARARERQQSLGSGSSSTRRHIVTMRTWCNKPSRSASSYRPRRVRRGGRRHRPKTDVVIKIKPAQRAAGRASRTRHAGSGGLGDCHRQPVRRRNSDRRIVSAQGPVIGAGPTTLHPDRRVDQPRNSGGAGHARAKSWNQHRHLQSLGRQCGHRFAIPITHARRIAEDLRAAARCGARLLGLSCARSYAELARTLVSGTRVGAIGRCGSPAGLARAGLQRGDVLLK